MNCFFLEPSISAEVCSVELNLECSSLLPEFFSVTSEFEADIPLRFLLKFGVDLGAHQFLDDIKLEESKQRIHQRGRRAVMTR